MMTRSLPSRGGNVGTRGGTGVSLGFAGVSVSPLLRELESGVGFDGVTCGAGFAAHEIRVVGVVGEGVVGVVVDFCGVTVTDEEGGVTARI